VHVLKIAANGGAALFAVASSAFWFWSAAVRSPDIRVRTPTGEAYGTDGDAAWDALEVLQKGARLSTIAAALAGVAALLQGLSIVLA
jgi:hypothetical protein